MLEILFHQRHAGLGDHEMNLFGITFDSHGLLPVLVPLAIAVVSVFILSKLTPSLKEAWDEATHVGGNKA